MAAFQSSPTSFTGGHRLESYYDHEHQLQSPVASTATSYYLHNTSGSSPSSAYTPQYLHDYSASAGRYADYSPDDSYRNAPLTGSSSTIGVINRDPSLTPYGVPPSTGGTSRTVRPSSGVTSPLASAGSASKYVHSPSTPYLHTPTLPHHLEVGRNYSNQRPTRAPYSEATAPTPNHNRTHSVLSDTAVAMANWGNSSTLRLPAFKGWADPIPTPLPALATTAAGNEPSASLSSTKSLSRIRSKPSPQLEYHNEAESCGSQSSPGDSRGTPRSSHIPDPRLSPSSRQGMPHHSSPEVNPLVMFGPSLPTFHPTPYPASLPSVVSMPPDTLVDHSQTLVHPTSAPSPSKPTKTEASYDVDGNDQRRGSPDGAREGSDPSRRKNPGEMPAGEQPGVVKAGDIGPMLPTAQASPREMNLIHSPPEIRGEKSEKQLFECPGCDLTFTRLSALRQHMLSHTGEKPHACDHCGRRFSLASNLRRHTSTKACKVLKFQEVKDKESGNTNSQPPPLAQSCAALAPLQQSPRSEKTLSSGGSRSPEVAHCQPAIPSPPPATKKRKAPTSAKPATRRKRHANHEPRWIPNTLRAFHNAHFLTSTAPFRFCTFKPRRSPTTDEIIDDSGEPFTRPTLPLHPVRRSFPNRHRSTLSSSSSTSSSSSSGSDGGLGGLPDEDEDGEERDSYSGCPEYPYHPSSWTGDWKRLPGPGLLGEDELVHRPSVARRWMSFKA